MIAYLCFRFSGGPIRFQKVAPVGQIRAVLGQLWPTFGKYRPSFADSGNCCPCCGRRRPTLTDIRPALASDLQAFRGRHGQLSGRARVGPRVGGVRPASAESRALPSAKSLRSLSAVVVASSGAGSCERPPFRTSGRRSVSVLVLGICRGLSGGRGYTSARSVDPALAGALTHLGATLGPAWKAARATNVLLPLPGHHEISRRASPGSGIERSVSSHHATRAA